MRPLLLILILVGCGSTELNPPAIQLDRTACEKCKMLISETQYAAAFYNGAGSDGYHIFDDIGCMVRQLRTADATPQRVWVHDFPTSQWITADSATYVYSSHLTTPMNYGYVAFRSPDVATQFASEHAGHVIATYRALLKSMEEIAQ